MCNKVKTVITSIHSLNGRFVSLWLDEDKLFIDEWPLLVRPKKVSLIFALGTLPLLFVPNEKPRGRGSRLCSNNGLLKLPRDAASRECSRCTTDCFSSDESTCFSSFGLVGTAVIGVKGKKV